MAVVYEVYEKIDKESYFSRNDEFQRGQCLSISVEQLQNVFTLKHLTLYIFLLRRFVYCVCN